MKKYDNYFRKQYKLAFNAKSVELYRNWFFAQWKAILSFANIQVNTRVLEIGSGIGTLYSFLQTVGIKRYVGLELDNQAVNFANKFYKTTAFMNKTFEEYKAPGKFDYIMAFEVLEHLDNPINALTKTLKLLSKGGKFIGTSPYPYVKNIYADNTHKYVLHPENWRKLFLEAGFKNVELMPMSFLPFIWRISKRLNIRIPFYLPFNNFISTTLIVATK